MGVQYDAGIWTFDAIGTVIEHNDVYGMLGGEADGTGGDTTTTAALRNAGSFKFMNNIVVATRPQSTPFPCGPNCSHNLFWGLPPAGHDALQADPLFTGDPPGTGSHRAALAASRAIAREFELRPASPALGAGADVPYSAAGDFFGNPIPAPPAIGCCQPKSR